MKTLDLKTNRPSAYDGLHGYNNLSKWVRSQGGIIVDQFITDHNTRQMFIVFNGEKLEYDYSKRSDVNNVVNSYYSLTSNDDHSKLRDKVSQFLLG